jgi:hypothetical protein
VKGNPPEVFALVSCCENLLAGQGGSDLGAGGPNFAKDIAVVYRLDIFDGLANQVQPKVVHNARNFGRSVMKVRENLFLRQPYFRQFRALLQVSAV